MTLKKVTPNDVFKIPASTFNAFIDMTRGKKQLNQRSFVNYANNKVLDFVNNTNDPIPMFAVMDSFNMLYQEIIIPDGRQFGSNDLCVVGIKPQVTAIAPQSYSLRDNEMRVCIVQEPLDPKQIGKCIIMGISKVRLKKEAGVDLAKPLFVTKIHNDNTKMAVTNSYSPDKLIWADSEYKFGIVQLGINALNQVPFVGILDCVPDTAPNTFKLIVKDYYSGRIYHTLNGSNTFYRSMTLIPPRPRSTAVIAQFAYTLAGLDYVEFRPFYDTQQTGIVKYNKTETILNDTVLGRRSSVDRIIDRTLESTPAPSQSESMWRQPD